MSAVVETPLARSLAIQLRVIHALLLREVITRYGRRGLGVLWLMLEPMLFTLGVAALWYTLKFHAVSNIPIVAFAITGYSSVLMWRNTTTRCAMAIGANRPLLYHRNVRPFDVYISRIVLEWVGATASLALLTIFFVGIEVILMPKDILLVIGGWLLLAWFSLGLALIIGVLSEISETIERTWPILVYILFPLSGAVFMVHWLPKAAQDAVLWLPMVHGVEMIRHGYFGDLVPTYESPTYFATVNLVMTLIGFWMVREISNRQS